MTDLLVVVQAGGLCNVSRYHIDEGCCQLKADTTLQPLTKARRRGLTLCSTCSGNHPGVGDPGDHSLNRKLHQMGGAKRMTVSPGGD